MYHIVTGGYPESGLRALMIGLYCIAILKRVLPSVNYNDVNLEVCIFLE